MASRRGSQGHHQLPVANVEVRGRFVEQDDGGVLGEQDNLYRLLDEILQTACRWSSTGTVGGCASSPSSLSVSIGALPAVAAASSLSWTRDPFDRLICGQAINTCAAVASEVGGLIAATCSDVATQRQPARWAVAATGRVRSTPCCVRS